MIPPALDVEVKTSRGSGFQLSVRDLDGIRRGGHLAALIVSRVLGGPRWALVGGERLSAGGFADQDLAALEARSDVAAAIDAGWADWILDRDTWQPLAEHGFRNARETVAWIRHERPPRPRSIESATRESALSRALAAFRTVIDETCGAEHGPRMEGQVHQALIEDVLRQLGYEIVENPIGIPDIRARAKKGTDLFSVGFTVSTSADGCGK